MLHLVTGGSGFVGSHIARKLYSLGEKVRILDIIDSPDRPKEIEFIKCDVLDQRGVEAAMKGVDYVFHNAALVPLTKAGDRFRKVNVEGTRIVSEAALKYNIKMFVHMSSSAIYGGVLNQCPITNDTDVLPIGPYGRAKLAGEREVQRVLGQKIPYAIIRPRTLVGKERLGIFQILFEWIRDGKNIYIIGKGNNLFQLLHIEDLVDFCILCVKQHKSGIYNLGTNRYSTLREDLMSLINHANTKSKIVSLPVLGTILMLRILDVLKLSPLAPWHYLTYHKPFYFDVSKPMNELGWRPKYSNEEMLIEAYDWFLEHYQPEKQQGFSVHRRPVKEQILKIIKWLS